MKKFTGILMVLGTAFAASASVIVEYSIDDTAGVTAETATDIFATDLTSPDWTLAVALDDFINIPESAGMEDGAGDDMVAAFASGQFVEFEISTTSDGSFALDELQMTLQRSSNGPQDWGLRISTDGFAGGYSDTGLADYNLDFNQGVTTTATLETIDLSGLILDSDTTYTFRVAMDDRASNSAGSSAGRFYDIAVTTAAIPEPTVIAMLGLSGFGALVVRRFVS